MADAARYRYSFTLVATLFAIAALALGLVLQAVPEDSAWRIPLSLGPAIPLAGFTAIILRYLLRGDELEQRIQLIAAVVSLTITLTFAVIYGLLDSLAGFPRINTIWIAMIIVMSWIMTGNIVRRRYR